jgi:hypothetical protein
MLQFDMKRTAAAAYCSPPLGRQFMCWISVGEVRCSLRQPSSGAATTARRSQQERSQIILRRAGRENVNRPYTP